MYYIIITTTKFIILSSLMSYTLPKYTKALTLQKSAVPHNPPYHDAVLTKLPISPPKAGQVAIKLGAVGFNHKDVWQNKKKEKLWFVTQQPFFCIQVWVRKGQYPGIFIGAVIGADGAGKVLTKDSLRIFFIETGLNSGTVVASGYPNDPLLNKRVFLMPCRGWEKDPHAPESRLDSALFFYIFRCISFF